MSHRVAVLAVAVALTSTALAQTSAVSGSDLSRGTTLLPGSSAFADEATATVYNPAGLAHVGAFNAWYIHERSNTRSMDNDALFFALGGGDAAGLGLSFEWLRQSGADMRAKTTLSFAGGPEALSLGVNINWFFGGPVQNLVSADLGLQTRPLRWLSLGFLVRNVNTPGNGISRFDREYTVGLGLRPLGERVTLGIDWIAPESLPPSKSRLQYTVQASVVRGLRLMGGLSHGFEGGVPLFFHLGLGVDLENIGYTQGIAFVESQQNWQYAVRFSADKYPSIVPKKSIAVVNLGDIGAAPGATLGSLLGIAEEDRYLRLLRFFERAAKDPELAAVVLKVEGAGLGLARADEVRTAIVKLRGAGKKVFAYVLSATDADYLMISACDGIYAAPEAMLQVDGLKSNVLYFGGAAKKLGVTVDVARVGKYKNSPDSFTRTDMSAEQREALNAYLDTSVKTVAERVLAYRKLSPEAWQASLDEGLKSTRRSKEVGQIDGVMTPDQFDDFLKEQLPGASVARGYRPFDTRTGEWGTRPEIAIIPVLGNITGGRNTPSPFGDFIAGAESFIAAINRAAEDPNVKAIVLRVDSGGGDGLASDLMYRAVLKARKKKPVVASMGDAAASGGYYVAMGAEEIFASPTTLTGSIGVFFLKPAVKQLAQDLGINQESISRGKLAGITDLYEPWTDEQRVVAQKWVDDFYDTFITEVASSRKLTKDAVHAVAQGRVWSGEAAKEKGLVDQLGGLMAAVAAAKQKAGLVGDDVDLTISSGGLDALGLAIGTVAPEALLQKPVTVPSTMPPLVQDLARKLGPASWMVTNPAIQARLEYLVEIE
ncbi:MAG: signal peptide peptidase SppA [Myxococcota bacterium]